MPAAQGGGHCCDGPAGPALHTISLAAPNPAATGSSRYVCPMCPGVVSTQPASCPVCGMALEPEQLSANTDEEDQELLAMTRRLIIAAIFSLPILLLAMGPMITGTQVPHWSNLVQAILCLPVLFWAGLSIWQRAWQSLLHRRGNMFTLIGLGTGAAFGYSLLATLFPDKIPDSFRHGQHVEVYYESAAMIVTLVLLGQVLELRARKRTGSAIRELMALTPPLARRLENDTWHEVPLNELRLGDRLQVLPGDRVPTDGEVMDGESQVDEAMLTGESRPVAKQVGSTVYGGTVNQVGSLQIRVTRLGQDTVLAQIVNLVVQAQRSRAPIQQLADRVASWFVPAVVACSLVTACAWWWYGPRESRAAYALIHAVCVLIVACPCALGLATPMSIVVGIGRGAQLGVLIRNAEVLQRLERIDTVVLDKTGTLTCGTPEVVNVVIGKDDRGATERSTVLAWAAALERHSEHPYGKAIVRLATQEECAEIAAERVRVAAGGGIQGIVAERQIAIGNPGYLEAQGIPLEPDLVASAEALGLDGSSRVMLAVDGRHLAIFIITDPIRPSAAESLAVLTRRGIGLVMVTGDSATVARAVAAPLGIEQIHAAATPADKLRIVRQLQDAGRHVAVVGDGINDAPALAAADVGMAMGTGTDIAMHSAGVTILGGDLRGVERAWELGHMTLRNIRQNLLFAFLYNGLGIPLAAGALTPFWNTQLVTSPMLAAAAMSFSSVTVILNALRLRFVGGPSPAG